MADTYAIITVSGLTAPQVKSTIDLLNSVDVTNIFLNKVTVSSFEGNPSLGTVVINMGGPTVVADLGTITTAINTKIGKTGVSSSVTKAASKVKTAADSK